MCVAKDEQEERKAAAAASKQPATNAQANINDETETTRTCAACHKTLACDAFNRNQWNKGDGKARCQSCVEASLAQEATQQQQSKDEAIRQAQEEVERAKASGKAQDILKAESTLSALEAEKVTGLKPIKMGRGKGRGPGGRRRGGGGGRR
jgi:superfamily II helicase